MAKDNRMQKISYNSIDLTEVSICEFSKFTKNIHYTTEAKKKDGLKKMAGIGKILME